MQDPFLESGIVIFTFMVLLYILALLIRDNSIVDIAWGPGFVLCGWTLFRQFHQDNPSTWITLFLVTLWGLRLGIHLFIRNRGRGEDPRYANWRKEWGKYAPIRAFFQVFMLQGSVMWIVLLPLTFTFSSDADTHPRYLFWIPGTLIFLTGFLIESVADYQLMKYKKDPASKGKICRVGLWDYSRHPNYFGEALLWWGIWLCSFSISGWWTLSSPLLITWLLMRVSGVPMTDALMKNRPGFSEWEKEVPAFFPRLSSGKKPIKN